MSDKDRPSKLSLFPLTSEINDRNHLVIGGYDTVELAANFGTPVYVFDEVTLRTKCRDCCQEFSQRYPDTAVIYACKAFINPALALRLQEEGLGLDVVSAGEIGIARSVAFPPKKVYFHGNNKSEEELELALEWGIGRIVVDNFHELGLLAGLTETRGQAQDILLRLSPGVDPHTHNHTTTGVLDSKFGFPIVNGQAEEALVKAMACPGLNLIGLHFHLGSPIFEVEPYLEAMEIVLRFAAQMKEKHGFELRELDIGGGFAIQYVLDSPPPMMSSYAEAITSALLSRSRALNLNAPRLVIEPGRAIVGQAGVALYRIGGSKDIPQMRKYVFVDGGMGDNIRPPLYGAQYEALVANKPEETETERVTIAGKFCESGDILMKDVQLPQMEAGDILAVPACGAYCLSMASNYNAYLKPAVVFVKEGQADLAQRRETFQDLIRRDLF